MPVSRHCSQSTGRGAVRSSHPRRPDQAAAASPRLEGVPDELAGLFSGVGLVAAGRGGSRGMGCLLSRLASRQPGEIIEGVAVNTRQQRCERVHPRGVRQFIAAAEGGGYAEGKRCPPLVSC